MTLCVAGRILRPMPVIGRRHRHVFQLRHSLAKKCMKHSYRGLFIIVLLMLLLELWHSLDTRRAHGAHVYRIISNS